MDLLHFVFIEHDEVTKWVANSCLIISAVIISVFPSVMNKWWSFLGFLVGHIIWTIGAIYLGDEPLVWLNGSFILLDVFAMWIRYHNITERDMRNFLLKPFNK